MPIYLPPIDRRRFLAGAVAAWFSGRLGSRLAFAADADPHTIALLADTHIAADRTTVFKEVNMAAHLSAVIGEIISAKLRPALGLVVGDLAQKTGQTGDYSVFMELLKPLREAGVPLHLTLGNHDHRDRFLALTPPSMTGGRINGTKLAEVIALPRANLFVVDTLETTDGVPGEVGAAQLAWLSKALDAHADKPAIIIGHHDPMFGRPPEGKKPMGLLDTAELFKLLSPRKQVKAYVYGHTHAWGVKQHESGIHLVNLPPTSYLFEPGHPSGWLLATLGADGAKLELRSLDAKHRDHGQVVDLKWRT
jgi:3',5'-cyclic-AMP phosphodiesterase